MLKKLFVTLLLMIFSMFFSTQATFAKVKIKNDTDVKSEKISIKRCPCKKIFEEYLKMTDEQIELADQNRKHEKEEIKALKKQIEEVKAKHDKAFIEILTDEQRKKLQKIKKEKQEGKSICPCGKNPYY